MSNLWLNPALLRQTANAESFTARGASVARSRGLTESAQRRGSAPESTPSSTRRSARQTRAALVTPDSATTRRHPSLPAALTRRGRRRAFAADEHVRGNNDFKRVAQRAQRASMRQLCLRLVAVALLGGSAAFSYVAWSDEARAGLVRSASNPPPGVEQHRTGPRAASTTLVHDMRRENLALRERIARLERAIGAIADGR